MRRAWGGRFLGDCGAAALLFALSPRLASGQSDASAWRAVTADAIGQVNHGTADSAAARLTRALADPALDGPTRDRARLALATVHRLRYRYATAESLYAQLDASGAAPARLHAALGRALAATVQARLREADSLFSVTAAAAREDGDTRTLAEALLAASAVRGRFRGGRAQQAALDSADAALAQGPADSVLIGQRRCTALRTLAPSDSEGMARALAAHVALADRHDAPRLAASCFAIAGSMLVNGARLVFGLAWLDSAVRRAHAVGDLATAASAGQWAGFGWITLGAYFSARTVLAQAMRDADAAGATNVLAWATLNSAQVLDGLGYVERARAAYDRSARLMTATSDVFGVGTVRSFAIAQALRERRMGDARSLLDAQLADARASGNPQAQLVTWVLEANARAIAGDADGALRADSVARSFEARQGRGVTAEALERRGTLLLALGRPREALPLLRQASDSFPRTQPRFRHEVRMRFAIALAEAGDPEGAAREALAAGAEFNVWRASLSQQALRASAFQSPALVLGPNEALPRMVAALARAGRLEDAMTVAEEGRARSLVDAWSAGETRRLDGGGRDVPATAATDATVDRSTALIHLTAGRSAGTATTVLLRTTTGVARHFAPPLDSLVPPIDRWLALLQGGQPDGNAAADVAGALLGPLLDALPPGTRRLIIVPDG
ncbi:MAG: hypothetical protein HY275_13855, partial [Gemmatimonadetes bacterium]|nr:hypothetical protein [Gemmatimonadota bacterium]